MKKKYYIFFILFFFNQNVYLDSFNYNSYNNQGVIGLINMPSARSYDESSYGITLYSGDPDQKITMTSSPYDWLEASFFYTNIDGKPYCELEADPVCDQDYKDKGFNFKIRLKEEDNWPAIAVGINDIGGTGFYSSEYLVASYGINKTDFHLGIGWGTMNGSSKSFKNPFGYLYDNFYDRPPYSDEAGQFQPSRYFSGQKASPFFGVSHVVNNKLILKAEYDSTLTPGLVGYTNANNDYSFGAEYNLNENLSIGISHERGNTTSLKIIYKNFPKRSVPKHVYKRGKYNQSDDKFTKFIKNMENNGIGVNKIIENPEAIGVEFTQFTHTNLDVIEEIIKSASIDAGIKKDIKKDLRIADLQGVSEYNEDFERNSNLIYERKPKKSFSTKTNISFRPFIASREDFFKGAVLLENNSEYVIRDNFFFSSNIKYSLYDNFDDLIIPPRNTYPAQVRSDIKDYLRNFSDGVIIGRAQFDYHITPKKIITLWLLLGYLKKCL